MKALFLANKYAVLVDATLCISCQSIASRYTAKNHTYHSFQLTGSQQILRSKTRHLVQTRSFFDSLVFLVMRGPVSSHSLWVLSYWVVVCAHSSFADSYAVGTLFSESLWYHAAYTCKQLTLILVILTVRTIALWGSNKYAVVYFVTGGTGLAVNMSKSFTLI